MKRGLLFLLTLVWLAAPARAGQVFLGAPQRTLSLGATFQLPITVEFGTAALGGYLFDIRYDTGILSLTSLRQFQNNEFAEEFFTGPGVAVGSGAFQGLNGKSLTSPMNSVGLALGRFQVSPSSGIFAAGQVAFTTVTVSVREAVGTAAQPIPVAGASIVYEIVGDTLAPVTRIVFDPPSQALDAEGRPILSSSTHVSFAAVDPDLGSFVSGVEATRFLVDRDSATGTFQDISSTASFTLENGTHTVHWFSSDRAGNREPVKSSRVFVGSPDSTPPETVLVVEGTQFRSNGDLFTAPSASFSFSAVDTSSGSTRPSGVDRTEFRVDDATGPFRTFVSSFTLGEGVHLIEFRSVDRAGNFEAVKSSTARVDATAPSTSLLVSTPQFHLPQGLAVGPKTSLSLSATDPVSNGVASGVKEIFVAVDTPAFSAAPASFSLPGPDGAKEVRFFSRDNVLNTETTVSATVFLDATPPVSSIAIGDPRFESPEGLLVSSRTPLSLSAEDPVVSSVASGVRETRFRVNGAAFALSSGSFTLSPPDGRKRVEFFSSDNVLNAEAIRSTEVVLDATPPEVALQSVGGLGFCAIVKGTLPVLGTAQDAHLAAWRLESAPGRDAAAGFQLIATATIPVSSGTLADWDTSILSGWQTLRLSASDQVLNASTASVNAFVGDPVVLLAIEAKKGLKRPAGVAVGTDGKIYVADTDNDRIAVFNAAGAFLASLGDAPKKTPNALRFDRPEAVAVDADGNIYVADTRNDRALKLSPAGDVLLTIPGLARPRGIALDGMGNIYVSDMENGQARKFSPGGAPLATFVLPASGRPAGLALDRNGKLYAADARNNRVVVFAPGGSVLRIIGSEGSGPGQFTHPAGVAVSLDGECILVSDTNGDRLQKFDRQGHVTGVFTLGLNKPSGLALDGGGNLYLADRNNNRVLKLGAPAGGGAGPPGAGGFGVASASPEAGPPGPTTARGLIARASGGSVERPDKAGVVVPPNALSRDLEITVGPAAARSEVEESERKKRREGGGLLEASAAVDYGPDGTVFDIPVTVVLPYDSALTASRGLQESDLKVYRWNPERSEWERLESAVDTVERTVSAQTRHFSVYQVLGASPRGAQVQAAADSAFYFRDLYAFPNPARRSERPTIRLQVGVADSVELRIYDISGEQVHSAGLGSPQVLDDGNGKGPQWTYDYAWDTGRVGSGVYIYVVTARKGGEEVKKIKKVAVIH